MKVVDAEWRTADLGSSKMKRQDFTEVPEGETLWELVVDEPRVLTGAPEERLLLVLSQTR